LQKLSKKKFELKCEELGIASKQSMFFKTGFFQKFGCSPFCSVHSIGTAAKSATKLKSSFQTLCQNEKGYITATKPAILEHIDNMFHAPLHTIKPPFRVKATTYQILELAKHLKTDDLNKILRY